MSGTNGNEDAIALNLRAMEAYALLLYEKVILALWANGLRGP